MKKKEIFLIGLVLLLIFFFCLLMFRKKTSTFSLDEKYYGSNEIKEIEVSELSSLTENKESFGVFIYQPMCATSADFEQVLHDFQEKYAVSFYKIAFSKVKDDLEFLEYYPSFIIYQDGKMVDFLEADKDDDVDYYLSVEGFEEWLTKYVELPETNTINKDTSEEQESENIDEEEKIQEEIILDGVIKEDGKVNIYFFYGDGCPHCALEKEFFASVEEEYGKYYNLHMFEVWYNEENAKMLDVFAQAMGGKATGIPYTIIGDRAFTGFNEHTEEQFKSEIMKQSKKGYDVYFDKIKK